MHPIDLVDALPWRRVVFTTYSLSLAFFEGVILERLIRGGGGHASIFSDPEGIRAALQEQGARGAGRDYELEPVASTRGVFHPKVAVFAAPDDCHLIIGSGNLTFGGWGGNFEHFEHLHPSFAADAFDDAADFFEYLAISEHVRIGSEEKLQPVAEELRRAAVGGRRDGRVRILSSLAGPLSDQVASLASELGGAERLTVVSPYFDANGHGVERLMSKLGCDSVRVHVHLDGSVRGTAGINWPSNPNVAPVTVSEPFEPDGRPLHSKCYEIVCRRGRLMISGSANATRAALEVGNVETVVVRIQREAFSGWSMTPASPPPVLGVLAEDIEEERAVGVLTASLEGDVLTGLVLTPRMSGAASLRIDLATGEIPVGQIILDTRGRFTAKADTLEGLGWMGGRMVAVIEQDALVAKGFVAFGAALEIVRRAGAIAPRIFAVLSGTETPEDAAAVLSWFHQNPELLLSSAHANYASSGDEDHSSVMITSEMLRGDGSGIAGLQNDGSSHGSRAWERAIEQLILAFRPNRPAWGDDADSEDLLDDDYASSPVDDDYASSPVDDEERRLASVRHTRAKDKVRETFDLLLDQMLAKKNEGRHAQNAFSLALYLVSRLRPPAQLGRSWLLRCLGSYSDAFLSGDPLALTTALLLFASDSKGDATIKARQYLLDHRIDPAFVALDTGGLSEIIDFFLPEWRPDEFLTQVQGTRSAREEVRDLLAAAAAGVTDGDYPILMRTKHWRRLDEALRIPSRMERLKVITDETACPKCHIAFSSMARDELISTGVTECCRLVVRTVSP